MRSCFGNLIFLALLLGVTAATVQAKRPSRLPAIPAQVASDHFTVTVNGQTTPVVHAAANYYLLSFPGGKKPLDITVTADQDGFWQRGVEVQPWRLGIRPTVQGRTISFKMRGPAQISITRPHDFLASAEMLFLFADPVETDVPRGPAPNLRYYGPGVHYENIDAQSGDSIYLAPGAFIFGSLNVWQVSHVRVWGRGTIIYDGPQNPADDDGWMHKPNWHCIVMDNANDVSIEGLTCIVRSRTWMIQMKDSHGIRYSNIKVIGGSNGNANQDGMDWLGGGDTVVEDSFSAPRTTSSPCRATGRATARRCYRSPGMTFATSRSGAPPCPPASPTWCARRGRRRPSTAPTSLYPTAM